MVYKLITAPTELAVSLPNAKAQLNIEAAFTDDDTLITDCINAAALYVEKIIQGPVMTQTWEAQMADFKELIRLEKNPVTAITSIKYQDIADDPQTVDPANYQEDLASVPARIIFNSAFSAPTVYDRFDAVQVRFVAGYTNEAALPGDLKMWIKILLTQFYESRDYSTVKSDTARQIREALMSHALWV